MKFIFDTLKYPFREIVEDILKSGPLEKLHTFVNYETFNRETDQQTIFHSLFYQNFYKMKPVYDKFIAREIRPAFGEEIIYQAIPTFRVHLDGNLAVGEFHRDSDYNHPYTEENFWLPFTDSFGSNSVWVESVPGSEDFSAVELDYGMIYQFNAAALKHGNKINDTGYTRVSMDFRVISESLYIPSDESTINTKIPFKIGGYYSATRDYS